MKGLRKGANKFGNPAFIDQVSVTEFLNSCRKRKKDKAAKLVNMIRELRSAMTILAENPILVDTGQYLPKYQNRTYAEMENKIARDLTQQPNFRAKVKLLAGEHVIQTQKPPTGLTGSPLAERIAQIQTQMRKNYCKSRLAVEKEIRERQEKWRDSASDEPPPTYYKV
jgi:hypothetical protein